MRFDMRVGALVNEWHASLGADESEGRSICGPPDVVVGGGEGWQHAYPRGDLVGERVRRQVDEVVSERSE